MRTTCTGTETVLSAQALSGASSNLTKVHGFSVEGWYTLKGLSESNAFYEIVWAHCYVVLFREDLLSLFVARTTDFKILNDIISTFLTLGCAVWFSFH